ncbi:MAG: hypothetical protein HY707_03040 [Ignavibacteriae bacterium]|nr:hypothetical protein [Ignavibacteriota bacterium]
MNYAHRNSEPYDDVPRVVGNCAGGKVGHASVHVITRHFNIIQRMIASK